MSSHRFSSIRELLQGAAMEVARTTGSAAAFVPIWNEAVGPSIARNAVPVSLEHGVLTVRVSDRQWSDALRQRERDVLERLAPLGRIQRLRFVDSAPHPDPLPPRGRGSSSP